jgi:ABC-type lipoprotein release transport system permease subunit
MLGGRLNGVRETDVASYVVTLFAIGSVALAASWIPARRASAISPLTAMKSD